MCQISYNKIISSRASRGLFILHENARSHAAQAVTDLFDRWNWEVLCHPPYSPDLSPCDFDLIPKMKGIHFVAFASNLFQRFLQQYTGPFELSTE
ncbi:uncharacterized protein TNCV_1018081 [Trichonephila clavipes]|uniref:Transposase n=1 Tax=Trichonephila clavipes TaxID=2585209 RepID=A0A8X6VYI8_TRICX|nr:uncharacterized protein TNCV_1018081 [Trichonephila clavipes]